MIAYLPHIDAALNGFATILLVIGYWLIRRRAINAHRNVMLATFAVSVLFLACYLTYHYFAGSKRFPATAPDFVRTFYFVVLLSHIVLAMAVPGLAITTIVFGLRGRWEAHKRWARWTFPIWLYVSITGVVVYVMLYHLYPPIPS